MLTQASVPSNVHYGEKPLDFDQVSEWEPHYSIIESALIVGPGAFLKFLAKKEKTMIYSMTQRKFTLTIAISLTVGLVSVIVAYGHTIRGMNNPTQATARLMSPNSAPIIDLPIQIPGTNLSIVCFKAQNTSPFNAMITAIGFDFPGDFSGFELVDPASVDPNNPAAHVTLQSFLNFSIENQTGPLPGFHCATLDFALQTGKSFKKGVPSTGLAPSSTTTTFCVKGPFPRGLSIEEILNYSFVRFQNVGPDGEDSDTGIWEKLLHP